MKTGLTIGLVNGWASDDALWSPLLPALKKYGLVKCIPLTRAVNEVLLSAPVSTRLTDKQCSILCDRLLADLPENTLLLGWSLGGMIAMRMAARCPEKIVGLVTLASNLRFVANDSWSDAMAATTFEQFSLLFQRKPTQALKRFALLETYGDENDKIQLSWLQENVSAIDNDVLAQGLNLLSSLDNTQVVSTIRCPVMHFFGERDSLVPVAAAREIKQQCPSHEIITLSNRGHVLHFPEAPLLEKLRFFLENL